MLKKLFYTFLLTSITSTLQGQENKIYHKEVGGFHKGIQLFDDAMYYSSANIMDQMAMVPAPLPFPTVEKRRREALLTAGVAELRVEDPQAESKLKYHIKEFYPDPVTIQPLLELASMYYYDANYDEAIKWYDKVEITQLPEIDKSEALFKKGYCHFVKKEFGMASQCLGTIKDFRNIFYYPSNYYYGMCQYFKGDYNGAVHSFKKVTNSDYYGEYIPYYLSQIYFAQKEYDLLISFGEQKITESRVNNKKEIRLLLGQTYYQRGDYERALHHLEFYEANTAKLTIEEFYQLAFTQYKLGKYEKAKSNFLELTYQDSKIGQVSNYYLADCYEKLGDKESARSAFKKVSQMTYDRNMQEEATFNFAKVSAELGYEREAINVFVNIEDTSPYYIESQDIINDILVNSGDYVNSIKIIESLPRLNQKLKNTYQSLALKRGIQLFDEGQYDHAQTYLTKSLKYPETRNYQAQSYFWQARMAFDNKQYNYTHQLMEQYFAIANGVNDLPEESSAYMAHYIDAYAYLKERNYSKAEIQFKNALVGASLYKEDIVSDVLTKRVLPDINLRIADCLFKQRKYKDAKVFYEEAIKNKTTGNVYALYQKGLIEGLTNSPNEKVATMEQITKQYPTSDYADDAYFQIGETYLSQGSIEPAAVAYIDLLAKFGVKSPYFNAGHIKLGLINYNRGEFQKALEYYKSVINFNPSPQEKLEAVRAIEEIYTNNLNDPEAFFAYTDSIPGYEINTFQRDSITYQSAYNSYVQGKNDVALPSFDTYIQQYANGAYINEAKYYRAEIHSVNKAYGKALQDYEQVIANQAAPFFKNAVWKAALISYNDARDFNKSLRYYRIYEGLVQTDAEKLEAQLGALRSAFKEGVDDEVIVFANKVNTNNTVTKEERATALYYLGKVYFKLEKYDQALAAFDQMANLVNTNQAAEAKYLISEIYYKKNDLDLAEKQCHFNNENNLSYPFWVAKSILLMSDIYMDRGDLINARAALEAVVENFKDDQDLQKIASDKMIRLKELEENANRIKVIDPKLLELDNKKND